MDLAQVNPMLKMTPEMDLATRFNITECPTLVFVPKTCNGWTQWCTQTNDKNTTYTGCADFKEQCNLTNIKHYHPVVDDLTKWTNWLLDTIFENQAPEPISTLNNKIWLRNLQEYVEKIQFENFYYPLLMPSSDKSENFEIMKVPKPIYNQWIKLWKANGHLRTYESLSKKPPTSYFNNPTTWLNLYNDQKAIINIKRFITPIVEKWYGKDEVELESMYGFKESLATSIVDFKLNHDKEHFITIEVCLGKVDHKTLELIENDDSEWPLDIATKDGRIMRYDLKPGNMIIYESLKVITGRFTKNSIKSAHVSLYLYYRLKNQSKWNELSEKINKLESKISSISEPKFEYSDSYVTETKLAPKITKSLKSEDDIEIIENIISVDEAEFLIQKYQTKLSPRSEASSGVTTSFNKDDYPLINEIIRRLAKVTQEKLENIETGRITKYEYEQFDVPHYDFYNVNVADTSVQRYKTIIIYLSSLEFGQGGETFFKELKSYISASIGNAVVIKNVDKVTKVKNLNSLNSSLPVMKRGAHKWEMIFYVRDKVGLEENKKEHLEESTEEVQSRETEQKVEI